jgi:hypothetical protein
MWIQRREYEKRLEHEFLQGQRVGYGEAVCDIAREAGTNRLLSVGLQGILKKLRPPALPDAVARLLAVPEQVNTPWTGDWGFNEPKPVRTADGGRCPVSGRILLKFECGDQLGDGGTSGVPIRCRECIVVEVDQVSRVVAQYIPAGWTITTRVFNGAHEVRCPVHSAGADGGRTT